jgi:FkbM family methyltransferase
MVTVKGLVRTLSIVKNPATIIALKLRRKPSKVTFPSGEVFHVTWSQFRALRDVQLIVKNCHIQQISDGVFKITTDNYQLIGSYMLMDIVVEMESGTYEYDYCGKVVLDVGGFEGESAAFFWSRGAKKIVIYEPVFEHHPVICENIRLNKINAELYSEGIGNKDDEITVVYDKADSHFGIGTKGSQNKMSLKIKDVSKVIAESGADVAKIDCEGAEISLINVPKEILRKLEYVIIEVHTSQIRQQLIEKFKNSGFAMDRNDNGDSTTAEEVSMVYFKRVPLLTS